MERAQATVSDKKKLSSKLPKRASKRIASPSSHELRSVSSDVPHSSSSHELRSASSAVLHSPNSHVPHSPNSHVPHSPNSHVPHSPNSHVPLSTNSPVPHSPNSPVLFTASSHIRCPPNTPVLRHANTQLPHPPKCTLPPAPISHPQSPLSLAQRSPSISAIPSPNISALPATVIRVSPLEKSSKSTDAEGTNDSCDRKHDVTSDDPTSSPRSAIKYGTYDLVSTIISGSGDGVSTIISANSNHINTITVSSEELSKITATSPKRVSRDGGGGACISKGRPRLESDGKSMHRPESSIRTSSREKKKAEQVVAEVYKETQHIKYTQDDPVYAKQYRYTEAVRDMGVACRPSRVDWSLPSGASSVTANPSQTKDTSNIGRKERQESRSQTPTCAESQHQTGHLPMSYDHTLYQDILRASRIHRDQGLPTRHGVLKDSSNDPSRNTSISHNQDGCSMHHYKAINEYSQRGSADPLYQQPCRSLGPSSRSTTPENVYSYGALPARSNTSAFTQHKLLYNNKGERCEPIPYQARSESEFSMGSIERDQMDSNYAVINYKKRIHGGAAHTNKTYGTSNLGYQPPRPDSVPPPDRDSRDSLYSVVQPRSVRPQHYSDSETGGSHVPRAGSVPVGYESGLAIHDVRREQSQRRNAHRNSETASDCAEDISVNHRVNHESKQFRHTAARRPASRRHTVSSPANKREDKEKETEKKREAFMQLLAQRYPQYADKIQGVESSPAPESHQQERPSRAREVQRRRTAVVTYNPSQASNVLEYDDLGTMSDLELPSFQRGGLVRTSLPIVRSASTSLERPLGLVFLVYGDQTKKSMLPNEITTLDTVRALFVRAFPDLTLEMLENPRKKIYLLDPATNIYFQLEDLMDIKDRSVLKIHETDSDQPQKVKVRQEVRGRTVQMPASRPHSQQGYGELPMGHEVYAKSQSLPPQVAHNYSEMMQEQRNLWEFERRSRSRTPELAERPRSLSAEASSRQRFSHSPDRLPTPERAPLNPIPENRQMLPEYGDQNNFYETVGPGSYRGQYPSGIYDSPVPYQSYPPSSQIPPQQTYIARSTRAPPVAHPQRAVTPGPDLRDPIRGSNTNRHSLAFAPMSLPQAQDGGLQHPQNYRIPPTERDGPEITCSVPPADDMTRNRIEKMEQQLANLTAWVHYQKDGTRRESVPQSLGSTTSDGSDTLPASSASKHNGETPSLSTLATLTDHVIQLQGLSDIHDESSNRRSSGLSSRESTPLSAHVEINAKLAQLKSDLHILRRQQQLNMEAMRDEFLAISTKIKTVLSSIPGAQNQVNFHRRNEATIAKRNYVSDKERVEKELSDLEASVEELRTDVISRQCRVNTSDVEGMALLLSNITKSLADLKAQFPEIHNLMKHVMDAELRVVVNEEKFLKEEPTEIEHNLKRCKKITGTLYTLKRLASVQDHRPPHVPNMAAIAETSLTDQKKALLDNIRALVPDHEQRVKEMEAADASRERKKKITSQQEALKFGKSLEIASKNLRPPSLTDVRGQADDCEEEVVQGFRSDRGGHSDHGKPTIPAKPTMSSTTTVTHLPSTITVSSKPSISVASTSVKPSFPSASASVKPLDKPTATVSAMTAGVSDTITMMATKATEKEPVTSITKTVSVSQTQTTECLNGTAVGRTEVLTHSVKVGTESPKKRDATVYTCQVSGSINPVFPVPTPVVRPENIDRSSKTLEFKENLTDVQFNTMRPDLKCTDMPQSLQLNKADSTRRGLVAASEASMVTAGGGSSSPSKAHIGHLDSAEKMDPVIQRQAMRSAFFSTLNSPPDSPSSTLSKRHSAGLELGPIVSPSQGGKVMQGPTKNLALSGIAVPRSPSNSGSYTNAPPLEFVDKTASSLQNSPARGIPRPLSDRSPSSFDPHLPTGSDSGSKQKKVPPPPPPRKDSRPTSANISPVNSAPLDLSVQHSRDMPQFVGGILGQHRLSGGPLFSTPKPIPQQKQVSRFEQDIACGIYANMNRPDLQSQKSSPQHMISEANIHNNAKNPFQSNTNDEDMSIPPPPSVTIALDREERGSSSESSSSSSGTSGSQQSVVSVIRSSSTSEKGSNKAKPDPPKRQSSLLAKFTGNKDSKSKLKNGKAKVNGVDL